MAQLRGPAFEEWRLGWALVLAAFLGFTFHSMLAAASGLFMQPLGAEFGWSRTTQSMGTSIASVTAVLLSPLFGAFIDRWGSRRIALPGLVVASIAIASLGLANGSITQWVALWTFYAFTSLTIKSTVWVTAVSGVFTTSRGLALGVTMAGSAFAQTITPPITNFLIDHYGWRAAYAGLGFGGGAIAFIACAFFLFDARDRFRVAQKRSPDNPPAAAVLRGLSVGEAWRDIALWKIAISTLIIMTVTIAILIHQYPILAEAGVSRKNAAWLASMGGIAGILGKLVTGWLMDRWHGRWVGGITLAATSLTFILLLEPIRTPVLIAVAMFINGYAAGTKLQICGYLTTRYAGLRNFGTIFGFMASVIAAGSGLGPLIGGLIFDHFGNYTPLLIAGIVGSLVSGALIASLGRYPDWGDREAPATTR